MDEYKWSCPGCGETGTISAFALLSKAHVCKGLGPFDTMPVLDLEDNDESGS